MCDKPSLIVNTEKCSAQNFCSILVARDEMLVALATLRNIKMINLKIEAGIALQQVMNEKAFACNSDQNSDNSCQ